MGLMHSLLDPSINVFRKGRVEDIYMDKNCAVVSLYGYRRSMPCLALSDFFNRWFGAKKVSPLSIGTEVIVICSNDHKYGIILGAVNAAGEWADKPSTNLFGTIVDRGEDTEAHKAKDWGFEDFLINVADGIPTDVFPGDDVTVNAQGALFAILELMATVRGGSAASLETFVFDQLVRLTGYNFQERTSLYDKNVMEDHGFVTEEESGSPYAKDLSGFDDTDETDPEEMASFRRYQNFQGWLGGLLQRFILRPNTDGKKKEDAESKKDLGLYQRYEHLSGLVLERSLTGGGTIKGMSIPVPKKKKEADDPSGNSGEIDDSPLEPFSFSETPGTPAGAGCQIRDYLAYHFNKLAAAKLGEMDKDWAMPDETDCPALSDETEPPGVGDFYRDFPAEVDAMSSQVNGDGVEADGSSGVKTRQGTAWCLVLPDGSVSIRDIWGSQIEMRGGHIDISASKDIRLSAGGSVVLLGGDDCIIKGRKSIDITATEGEVRVKAQQEMYLHAEQGGMLISLGNTGGKFTKKDGEDRVLPGICIKVPNNGGVTINAGQLTCNLANALFINEDGEGHFPSIIGKINGCYLKFEQGSSIGYLFENGALGISNSGGIFMSGDILSEGAITTKGSAAFGSEPAYPTDWSDVEPVVSQFGSIFADIDKYQWQFQLTELKENYFVFRTTENYATEKGVWFESFWQREMSSTEGWQEKPDKDGQFPYPGKKHYEGGDSFWKYKESNVDNVGKSKKRESLESAPDGFSASSWHDFPVHPSR
jgi:hypothetical protein